MRTNRGIVLSSGEGGHSWLYQLVRKMYKTSLTTVVDILFFPSLINGVIMLTVVILNIR